MAEIMDLMLEKYRRKLKIYTLDRLIETSIDYLEENAYTGNCWQYNFFQGGGSYITMISKRNDGLHIYSSVDRHIISLFFLSYGADVEFTTFIDQAGWIRIIDFVGVVEEKGRNIYIKRHPFNYFSRSSLKSMEAIEGALLSDHLSMISDRIIEFISAMKKE